MISEQARVGTHVRTLVAWYGVPAGTEGVIDEDAKTGVVIAWDSPIQRLPEGYTSRSDPRFLTRNLLRSWFRKQDLSYLEVDPKDAAEALDQAIIEHDDLERRIARNDFNFGGTS